jgi:hypothetical protein
LIVGSALLAEVSEFLEDAGSRGTEGTGMIAGVVDGDAIATRFIAPEQEAGTFPTSWVKVTDAGKRTLATSLASGELWIARVHSHPGEPFHSSIDEVNPGLTAVGSWSIVVPYFGLGLRRGIGTCAVYQRDERGWHRLTESEIRERVVALP